MTPDGYLRVSDAERDAVAADLREHHAEGRLDVAELSTRLDAVFAARTRDDLAAVTTDLPGRGRPRWAPPPGFGDPRGASRHDGAHLREPRDLMGRPGRPVARRPSPAAAVLAIIGVLWLVGGVFGAFLSADRGPGPFPLIFLVVGILVIRSRRRRRAEAARERDRYLPR